VGKEAGTTSNVSFVMAGELSDSGVRKLSDGKTQVDIDYFEFENSVFF